MTPREAMVRKMEAFLRKKRKAAKQRRPKRPLVVREDGLAKGAGWYR